MPSILIHEHRNLRFAISTEGEWLVGGEIILHPGIRRYLYSLLTLNRQGEPVVKSGPFELPVDVHDAAYIVNDVNIDRDQGIPLIITLNDGSRERLAPQTLSFSRESVPYCRVKEGRFMARFSRPAYYRLAAFIQSHPDGMFLSAEGWSHRIECAPACPPGEK